MSAPRSETIVPYPKALFLPPTKFPAASPNIGAIPFKPCPIFAFDVILAAFDASCIVLAVFAAFIAVPTVFPVLTRPYALDAILEANPTFVAVP